jgi:ABC-type Na+ efflux pump permease subunit
MPRDLNNPKREPTADPRLGPQTDMLKARALGGLVIRALWICTVILWPLLRWVIALDCVVQLIKTMYHWNTPGSYAGIVFILHFLVFSALTYFVSAYRPKGF